MSHASLTEPQKAIDEVHTLQERIVQDARRIHELSRSIHQYARRTPPGQLTSAYVSYANVWTRFAGMVEQGLRRTSIASRTVISALNQSPPEPVAPKPPIKTPPKVYRSPAPPNDDFAELFGEDLTHAK